MFIDESDYQHISDDGSTSYSSREIRGSVDIDEAGIKRKEDKFFKRLSTFYLDKISSKEILEARIAVIGGSFCSEYFGKNTYIRDKMDKFRQLMECA